jgi:ribosomal protein L40E
MAKFPEADARIFHNKFVCKKCKATIKTSNQKVLDGKVTCKDCGSHAFRPIKKK